MSLRHGDLYTSGLLHACIFMIVRDPKPPGQWYYTCVGWVGGHPTPRSPFNGNLQKMTEDYWTSSEQYIGNMQDILSKLT